MIRNEHRPMSALRQAPKLLRCAVIGLVIAIACGTTLLPADEPAPHELAGRATALLHMRCGNCHGADKQEAGLRVDTRDSLLRGGEQGKAIEPGRSQQSLLVRSLRATDEAVRMPPKDPLAEAEIKLIEDWIAAGAPWPQPASNPANHRNDVTDVEGAVGPAFNDPRNPIHKLFGGQRLDLWSLQPITRPALPTIANTDWPINAIDVFILDQWQQQYGSAVRLAPEADLSTLMRRLAVDLTGLPPTMEAVDAGLDRQSVTDHESAYRGHVEYLLTDPDYGVRWARMWLDVVRYSDSNGFDWDEFRPQAWRYRDYVVNAWNEDLPFDQFVTEQLAGDELVADLPQDASEQSKLIATGYLRMGPHDNAAALFDEQDRSRAELLTDLTETTGSAFLGLTLSCCRCHDHKTDPLSQADHYRLRAFFAAVRFADDMPLDLPPTRQDIERHNAPLEEQIQQLEERIKAIPEDQRKNNDQVSAWRAEQKELIGKKCNYTHGLLARDKGDAVPPTHILHQGDHKAPRDAVAPGFPSVLAPGTATILAVDNATSTGRRTALARWIVQRNNPWTARVIVNRLWQAFFGTGLVPTANDFGISGQPPSNAALLDWLASELMDSNWSLKHIQRLIVTSRTYRQMVVGPSSGLVSARTSFRRLEAEAMRDAILTASGQLNGRKQGPPAWPELPKEILQANPAFLDDNETKTKGWYPSTLEEQNVRSLFLIQKRTVRIPFLETFDLPDNSVSCSRRDVSLVAPQALSMLNSELMDQAAKAMAKRVECLVAEEHRQADQVELRQRQAAVALQLAFQRHAADAEMQLMSAFLQTRSLTELCRSLLNTNEFAFIE